MEVWHELNALAPRTPRIAATMAEIILSTKTNLSFILYMVKKKWEASSHQLKNVKLKTKKQ